MSGRISHFSFRSYHNELHKRLELPRSLVKCRGACLSTGGIAYHVLNRRVGRLKLIEKPADYSPLKKFLFKRTRGFEFLTQWPMERPQNWIEVVNAPDNGSQLDDFRTSAQRGRPFGSADCITVMAKHLGLGSTLRARSPQTQTKRLPTGQETRPVSLIRPSSVADPLFSGKSRQ